MQRHTRQPSPSTSSFLLSLHQVYAATAPGLKGGEYLVDCNLAAASTTSHDAVLGRRLWEFSEKLIGKQ